MFGKIEEQEIIEPPKFEYEPYISIPLEEYKELLIYKGKYLGFRDRVTKSTMFADGKTVATIIKDEE